MNPAQPRHRPGSCIGINASWTPPGHAEGLEWYVGNLIQELGALDDRHEWLVVTSEENRHAFALPRRRWRKIVYDGGDASPTSYLVQADLEPPTWRGRVHRALARFPSFPTRRWSEPLNELLRRYRVDLWFCPAGYALPVEVEVPVVHTVADLLHEGDPERLDERELVLRTLGYHSSCRRAATTIGTSEFVARDLLDRYRIDRTAVIPLGLEASLHTDTSGTSRLAGRARSKHRIEGPFVYCPSEGGPRDYQQTVMRAFGLLREKRRDLELVVTGRPFDVTEASPSILPSPAETRAVRHLGQVDRHDRLGLSAAASVVVLPGQIEGFAVPLLEAMACGTPVVCPPVGGAPEVGGDAALHVDPDDPAALAGAVLRLLEDDLLRSRLIAAGRQRARRSTFTETARQTLAVFDEVLAGTWRAPELPPFRPLVGDHWLRDGHGRWYFHCAGLRAVRLRVAQPRRQAEPIAQRVTVSLNEQVMGEVTLEPERERTLTITPRPAARSGLHRLDVTATVPRGGDVVSVQVRELTITGDDGRSRTLIA